MTEARPLAPAEAWALTLERQGELLDLLGRLLHAPSPAGGDGRDAQDVVAAYLRAQGFGVCDFAVEPSLYRHHPEFMAPSVSLPAVNLIARPPADRAARVLLFAHVDTRDPSAMSGRVQRDGDRLYGPGVADDKAGVAAAAGAAAILLANGCPVPAVVSAHAKGGGARGMLPAIERVRDVDAAVYVHPAETGQGLQEIKHASRGVVDVALRVTGWTGQEVEPGNPESVPLSDRGNALVACLAVIDQWRRSLPHGCLWNLGSLAGGEGSGATPLEACARGRLLFDAPLDTATVLDWLEREAATVIASLGDAETGGAFRATVTAEGLRANPALTTVDDRWYGTVNRAIAAVTGRAPRPYAGHISSDIRFPTLLLGVPCVGIGPMAGNFHGRDEWVDVPDLLGTVATLVLAVSSFQREISC